MMTTGRTTLAEIALSNGSQPVGSFRDRVAAAAAAGFGGMGLSFWVFRELRAAGVAWNDTMLYSASQRIKGDHTMQTVKTLSERADEIEVRGVIRAAAGAGTTRCRRYGADANDQSQADPLHRGRL